MKKRVVNPYLPSYEYVPDGKPHVFDGRLYIFGSHDRFGSKSFCANDYTCWSAPCDDLSKLFKKFSNRLLTTLQCRCTIVVRGITTNGKF